MTLNLSDFAFTTSLPIGVIIPFCGGYFTGNNNEGFLDVLGNTVNDVNTALNHTGWYVCDGQEPGIIEKSPIFNVAGRKLPNLINTFIMGGISTGAVGGSNTIYHTHTINPHKHSMGYHYHTNDHIHDIDITPISYNTGTNNAYSINKSTTESPNNLDTSPPSKLYTEDSIILSTDLQSNEDNRPLHITMIPIMKIF